MPYSRDSYIFFWRETGTYGWGSQWYPSPFRARVEIPFGTHTIESSAEHSFATAEHWMMGCKALLFGDGEAFSKILAVPADDPREVKRLTVCVPTRLQLAVAPRANGRLSFGANMTLSPQPARGTSIRPVFVARTRSGWR